ncbi:MAG: LysM peptidoglycan-binding domain-containing protein [Chlamydiales bacterium]|nr:LysM peptidoglycan-binding domain-containing protein [Chlamydiales bacterium]
MSRRDLIIVAVLVNAGLMTIFFVSALKSNSADEGALAANSASISSISEVSVAPNSAAPSDEIDQVLKEHNNNPATSPIAMVAPSATLMPTSPPLAGSQTAPSFADDLKAISMGESSLVQNQTAQAPQMTEAFEAPAASLKEVKVKKGDVLEKIARQNGVSVDDLMKTNQLASTRLKIGQTLKIPAKGASKSAQSTSSAAGESAAQYYTVKNGDNPWTIAVKNHLKVEELLKLNGLNEEKARRLKPGDKLRIK